MTRNALVESLELLNYQVLFARNGQEVLDLLVNRHNIRLVLSDVVMPDMGGLALLRAMQTQGLKVKVILLTGYPLREELDAQAAEFGGACQVSGTSFGLLRRSGGA